VNSSCDYMTKCRHPVTSASAKEPLAIPNTVAVKEWTVFSRFLLWLAYFTYVIALDFYQRMTQINSCYLITRHIDILSVYI
jgi:hypothetical protein